MKETLTLNDLTPGDAAIIKKLYSTDSMRRRLLDIGLIENTRVECVGQSPFGDPKAFNIRGAIIAIRSDDSKKIAVSQIFR